MIEKENTHQPQFNSPGSLIPHIESLIFASEKPLTLAEILDLMNSALGFMDDKITPEQIEVAISGIVEKYHADSYPFEVKESGGGWQFLTKKQFHKTVARLNGEKFLKRLSSSALETLAIIAYKQPITKGEIESIRGVSSDYSVQKLLEKELVIISGRNEKMPGHPLVYNTSKNFMDYFGINSPEEMPKIREVLGDQVIQPTIVKPLDFEQESALVVTDDGELIIAKEEVENERTDAQMNKEQGTDEQGTDEQGISNKEQRTDEQGILNKEQGTDEQGISNKEQGTDEQGISKKEQGNDQ